MQKRSVLLWPKTILSNMGIQLFTLIGLFLVVASPSVTCLQPINGEGKQSTLKHGVTEYTSYRLQMQNTLTAACSKFLAKDLGVPSFTVDFLDCSKKTTGNDVTAAVNLRLHRKLAQLHINIHEHGADSEPAEATNTLTTKRTTSTSTAEDIGAAPLPIIAHTNNVAAVPIIARTDSPGCAPLVKGTGSRLAKALLLPTRITATSDCGVHSRENTDHGIRAHVPLNGASSSSVAALSSRVAHVHSINNAGGVAGEANQLNDDPISAKNSVMYPRLRAHGLVEVQEQAVDKASAHASPSSYSPYTAASSVDHDQARAFHVDYSGPKTHPPRNN